MYTIKGAAALVGISPSTLRAWERRYEIVEPGRSDGGYRIYSAQDVEILGLMARLVNQGRPASLAAAEAKRRRHADVRTTIGGPTSDASATVPKVADHALIASLVDAASELDGHAVMLALDEVFGAGPFEAAMDTHLLPAMEAIGNAWVTGRVSVAGEHLVASAVMRRLSTAYEAAAAPRTGPRVLMGMAPGGHHELGLFAFAVALRRQGVNTDYLGANVPVDDWTRAVGSRDVAAVVLTIPTTADAAPVRRVTRAISTQSPGLLIAVGGAEQGRAPRGVLPLGHRLGPAAQLLARELSLRPIA